MSNFDGIRVVDEISPVEGYNPLQKTKGLRILNTVDDKLLSIPNEQTVGKYAEWNVTSDMSIKSMRVNLGIASIGGNVVYSIRKNGTQIGTLTISAGVLVQQFLPAVLSNVNFNEGDKFRIVVLSSSASIPAYHLNFQLDYKLR